MKRQQKLRNFSTVHRTTYDAITTALHRVLVAFLNGLMSSEWYLWVVWSTLDL